MRMLCFMEWFKPIASLFSFLDSFMLDSPEAGVQAANALRVTTTVIGIFIGARDSFGN